MGTAIQVSNLTKVYERYSHKKQFRTLKRDESPEPRLGPVTVVSCAFHAFASVRSLARRPEPTPPQRCGVAGPVRRG